METILQEKPRYWTMLFRKSSKVKLLETAVFMIIIVMLSFTLGYAHPYFKVATILSVIITLGLSPLIYKAIVKPMYTLTKTELVINKYGKETRYTLNNVKEAYDLKFFYLLDNKKTPLTVSDNFLILLEEQLDNFRKKK